MTENGFDYVDLGLASGTMWATCNVGADKPEEHGLFFLFGHVDAYNYHDTYSKYVPVTVSGKVYKENDILDLSDDAAHANMGGKWRMSTKDELEELFNNTTHKVETINGVKGMLFISNINGCQLFIPFAGYWYNSNFIAIGSDACVWSSQVHSSDVDNAYTLDCYSSGNAYVSHSYRAVAFSVRGVFKSNVKHNEYNNINMLI